MAMVARICARSPKYEGKRPLAEGLAARAEALRMGFLERKERDEHAFEAVVAARGDAAAVQQALHEAAAVPLEGVTASLEALQLASDALALGNANLASDLGCAAEFAYAALRACAYNVRINHKHIKDRETVWSQAAELKARETEGVAILERVRFAVDASFAQ